MTEVCAGVYKLESEDFDKLFPADLLDIPNKFYAPYGFKLTDANGEKRWEPGTFDDYRAVAARLKNMDPANVKPKLHRECYNAGPRLCEGGCTPAGSCGAYWMPEPAYLSCHCMF